MIFFPIYHTMQVNTIEYRSMFSIILKIQSVTSLLLCCLLGSRHTVVCRAAQEAGALHREYIDRKNENVIFTHLYLGDL